MRKIFGITALSLALVCAVLFGTALAKRLGGGGSFGSRPSYSGGYTKPVSPAPGYGAPSQMQQQAPQTAPGTPAAAPLPAPGFSRMGWGLGGFMAGGLLGSMLFGGGGGMGGGIGLLDILLVGLIVYLIIKVARRSGAPLSGGQQDSSAGGQPPAGGAQPDDIQSRAARNWDALRSEPKPNSDLAGPATPTGGFGVTPGQEQMPAPAVPQGFNVPEFLDGAKTVYARLQHSWDRRDLADIALFTTPEVLAEIKRQALADPTPSKTELVMVEARLLEFREEAKDTVATVLFDVLLREDVTEERPKQIREVWHFSRPLDNAAANWRLEGIQQLEV